MIIIEVKASHGLSSSEIAEIIKEKYQDLSNYHYMVIVFEDERENVISWETIAEVGIYMEHFKNEYSFNLYKKKNKDRRIEELNSIFKK